MGSERQAAIETVHLTKVFRDFWRRAKVRAVDDLNITVQPGEVYGLLGPNGSGKSTAVKMMLGLLFPTKGTVAVLGRHPRNQRMKERVGFLPEETHLYRYLNAEETLDFFARLFNLPASHRQIRIERLLDMVGLRAHRRRPLGEYSKGMARRIGLAQALINDPDLLFLDEPTSGLDPIGNREIKDLILELKARGKTVFICSHLLADVEDVCDRIGIMYGGKLRIGGPVKELLQRQSITRIETESLTQQQIEEIVAFIRKHTGDGQVNVDTPMVRLEDYFLDVVEKARQEEPLSSGVAAGGKPTSFWDEGAATGKEVIESLVQKEEPEEEETEAPAVAPETPSREKRERREVLEGLVQPAAEDEEAEPSSGQPGAAPEGRSDEEKEREERRRRAEELLRQYVNEDKESSAEQDDASSGDKSADAPEKSDT